MRIPLKRGIDTGEVGLRWSEATLVTAMFSEVPLLVKTGQTFPTLPVEKIPPENFAFCPLFLIAGAVLRNGPEQARGARRFARRAFQCAHLRAAGPWYRRVRAR